MKGRRRHTSWQDLRAPAGGVRLQLPVDPDEALLRRMRDLYVVEYDDAISRGDVDATTRLAKALRELGVRL